MGKQCKSEGGYNKCQGISGHSNHHWCYDLTGQLIQWRSKRGLKKHDWASSWTPPGHKEWISPIKMLKFHYIFGNKK